MNEDAKYRAGLMREWQWAIAEQRAKGHSGAKAIRLAKEQNPETYQALMQAANPHAPQWAAWNRLDGQGDGSSHRSLPFPLRLPSCRCELSITEVKRYNIRNCWASRLGWPPDPQQVGRATWRLGATGK